MGKERIMLTWDELVAMSPNETKDAITKSLADIMLSNGRVRLDYMTPQQFDMAVYLLRQFKALAQPPRG